MNSIADKKFNICRLMETGNYGEVEIRLGNRTWKIHTAIVAAQSDYLRALFTGGFQVSILFLSRYIPDLPFQQILTFFRNPRPRL